MPGDPLEQTYADARRVLLDGLEALGPHRAAVILVGAQAIYLHTGDGEFALPAFTRDGDLVLDRDALEAEPLIEVVLAQAGFVLSDQPGTWLGRNGIPLDLLVPEATAGPGGRRSVRLDPHHRKVARRVVGLEAALTDNTKMSIAALGVGDSRHFEIRVAGVAALLVAKSHKVAERLVTRRTVQSKDAFDIFRLVQHTATDRLVRDMRALLETEIAADVTSRAIDYLQEYFSANDSEGCRLAQEAVGILDPDGTVAPSFAALVQDLLAALPQDGDET